MNTEEEEVIKKLNRAATLNTVLAKSEGSQATFEYLLQVSSRDGKQFPSTLSHKHNKDSKKTFSGQAGHGTSRLTEIDAKINQHMKELNQPKFQNQFIQRSSIDILVGNQA
jgi:hypothetical protein